MEFSTLCHSPGSQAQFFKILVEPGLSARMRERFYIVSPSLTIILAVFVLIEILLVGSVG